MLSLRQEIWDHLTPCERNELWNTDGLYEMYRLFILELIKENK